MSRKGLNEQNEQNEQNKTDINTSDTSQLDNGTNGLSSSLTDNGNEGIDQKELQLSNGVFNANEEQSKESNDKNQETNKNLTDVTDVNSKNRIDQNSLVNEREGLDFIGHNIIIKDNVETVSKQEIEAILKYLVSEREYKSVLSYAPEIKNGGTGLTYYQLFDRMLSKSIYLDAVKIGLTLKNKNMLRGILYNVIDAIPKRVGRRNQGYLRDNMMISRVDVHTHIRSVIFKFFKNKNKDKDYRHGLASILEVTLLSQFIYFDLIEASEFDNKNLLSLRDNLVQDMSFDSIKNQCVTRQIKKIVTSTLSTAGKLSSFADSDSKSGEKSVDFSVIIDTCLKELDDIADSLLTFNSDYADFDTLLILARIYRDRRLFLQIPDFKLFTEEVIIFVEANITLFNLFLENVQFNEFMDELSIYDINRTKSVYSNMISIKKERWLYLMTELRTALLDVKQPIRLYDKSAFLDMFVLDNSVSNDNKPYHVFLRRNITGNHFAKLSEILSQESDFQKDIVNIMGAYTNAISLVSDKHYGGQELENLIYSIVDYQVKAAESQLLYNVKLQMPQYTDFCVHQYTMLLPGDVRNLAALLSKKVIKFYEHFCDDIIKLIPTWDNEIEYLIRDVDPYYKKMPIYVTDVSKYVEHKDKKYMLNGSICLHTRLSKRVLEQSDSFAGTGSLRMIDNLLEKGRYYVSQRYQMNDMWKDFVILPDDKYIEFELPSLVTMEGVTLPAMRLKYDLYQIIQPLSNYTETIMPTSNYRTLCSNYIKSLIFFTNSNNSITYGYTDDDSIMGDEFLYNKDTIKALHGLSDQGFALGTKSNIVNWPSLVASMNLIFELQLSYIQACENGRPLAFVEGKASHIIGLGVPKELSRQNIFNHFKDLFQARAFSQRYCTFSSLFVSMLRNLYDNNNLYKSIVDNSLASSKLDSGSRLINDMIDVATIMNSKLEGNVLGYYLKRALIHVAVFIDLVTSYTGDLKHSLNDEEGDGNATIQAFFKGRKGLLSTLYTITEIYSLDRVNIDNIINKLNAQGGYVSLVRNSFFGVIASNYRYENEIVSTITGLDAELDKMDNMGEFDEKLTNKENLIK